MRQIISGWRLLQSLAMEIFDSLDSVKIDDMKSLLQFAPIIQKNALVEAFSRSLVLDCKHAEAMIDVFVFDSDSHEIWLHPLVAHEDDYCLVIPCIHSVHLLRIIEGWMRQGGLDLERRGPEFERFCIENLNLFLKNSPIKEYVTIVDKSVKFRTIDEPEVEIDIVILVENTILLVEAKCILWPDDSLQFSNYHDTTEKAVKQISRKKEAVKKNYAVFSKKLGELGYLAPENPNVICCVVTNSAVFSGFPINDVPIVDIPIIGTFFENEYVKIEGRQEGKVFERRTINFYSDAANAAEVLENYLFLPPQLSDINRSVKKREVEFPIENHTFGKIIKATYAVEMDFSEMQKKYETNNYFKM